MAQPNTASVSIGSNTFRAVGVHFGISTPNHGAPGVPHMPSVACSILVMVDLNDQKNVPFSMLKDLFDLSYLVTADKIQDIVLNFWSDDSAGDVICTYSFRGWISDFTNTTGFGNGAGAGGNHILTLTLQPEIDPETFIKIQIGN